MIYNQSEVNIFLSIMLWFYLTGDLLNFFNFSVYVVHSLLLVALFSPYETIVCFPKY